MLENLSAILSEFAISGTFVSIDPLKKGHINDTYVSVWEQDGKKVKYVHQRVNHNVFRHIPELMENIVQITAHVAKKLEQESGEEKTLVLVPCKNKQWFIEDASGNYWRTYEYVSNSESYYVCPSAARAREAARMCGRFQKHICDLNPADFHETIPEFHNTTLRYHALREAIAQDCDNRAASAEAEIAFALEREEQAAVVVQALKQGEIPLRVTHNDLKFNNVMFDKDSGKGVAVVDLDTCMPGSILYDFGDLVRNTSVPANEDETDLSKVYMDLEFFEALVQGYFGEIATLVTPREWDLVAFAPRLMTLTIGVRFLTDYLKGDLYFKTEYPEHNLDRAKNQFHIIRSMEGQASAMEAIVQKVRR